MSRGKSRGSNSIRIVTRTYDRFVARARRVRDLYRVDSKKIREKAIQQLQELAEEAHKRATSKNLPTEVRQKWARIEAYIYQVLNSILKSYDEEFILEKLEELAERVEEIKGEGQEPGEGD